MGVGISNMRKDAVAVGSLAAVVLVTLAVIGGFKNTNLIDNGTADLFTTGLTIFATFIGVIVLAIVGKMVVSLFKDSGD